MGLVHFLLLFFLLFLNGIVADNVVDSASVVKTTLKEEEKEDAVTKKEYCSSSSSSSPNSNADCRVDENVVVVGESNVIDIEAVSNNNNNNEENTNDAETESEADSDSDDAHDDEEHDHEHEHEDEEHEHEHEDEEEHEHHEDDDSDEHEHEHEHEQQHQEPKPQNIQLIANTVLENANIGLPMAFTPVIEEIDSKEKLFELIPQQSQVQQTQSQRQLENKNHTEGGAIGGAFNNILLAIYEDECAAELMSNPFFIGGYYNIGPGVFHTVRMKKQIFPKIIADWNLPQTSCMHVLFIKKGFYYQDFHRFKRLSSNTPQGMAVFLEDHMGLEINVTNTLPFDVFLNWWEDEAEPVEVGYIISKQTSTQSTFLGHIFYAEDAVARRLVNWFIVVGEGAVTVRASTYCEEQKIEDADTCDKKFRESFKSFVYEYWARKREALNYVQRNVVKPVTEKGFVMMDLPDSLHESLLNFVRWSDEENWWLAENQTAPILNHEKSPSYLSHLGEEQREEIDEWLTPQIQQWSGIEHIELHSIFGMRKYTKNAQLQMHVDPITSHLLSAIIFIKSSPFCESSVCEQSTTSNNGEEWPIQILDNHDSLHEIVMKHGQVLLYESARNPYSRIKPFSGESYTTLYVHFKSQDEDDIHNYDWMFQEDILCTASNSGVGENAAIGSGSADSEVTDSGVTVTTVHR